MGRVVSGRLLVEGEEEGLFLPLELLVGEKEELLLPLDLMKCSVIRARESCSLSFGGLCLLEVVVRSMGPFRLVTGATLFRSGCGATAPVVVRSMGPFRLVAEASLFRSGCGATAPVVVITSSAGSNSV